MNFWPRREARRLGPISGMHSRRKARQQFALATGMLDNILSLWKYVVMSKRQPEPTAVQAITELILETFRLNGRLLDSGDALVHDLGLTSARWQVLGAIAAAQVPLPIAHIARNMGLSRQAVQRLADVMETDGLLRFEDNPHHSRAKLAVMTDAGKAAFRDAMGLQQVWAGRLAEGMGADEIEAATRLLRALRIRLEE